MPSKYDFDNSAFQFENRPASLTKIREPRFMFNDEYNFDLHSLGGLLAYLYESEPEVYFKLLEQVAQVARKMRETQGEIFPKDLPWGQARLPNQ
jgi:hypothetical protein